MECSCFHVVVFFYLNKYFQINSLCSLVSIIHIFTLLRFRNEEERKTTKTVIKRVFHPPHDKKSLLFLGKKVHGRTVDIKADPFFFLKMQIFLIFPRKV